MRYLFTASFILVSTLALADPVTVNLSATVTSVFDAQGYLHGAIQRGTLVTGSYTFESTTPDSVPLDPLDGAYHCNSAPCGFTLSSGGFHFMTNPNNVDFTIYTANFSLDFLGFYSLRNIFDVTAADPRFPSDTLSSFIVWALRDDTARALTSDALPQGAPIPNAWDDVNNLVIQSSSQHTFFDISAHVDEASLGVIKPKARHGGRTR